MSSRTVPFLVFSAWRVVAVTALAVCKSPAPVHAQEPPAEEPHAIVTSSAQRRAYLAKASVWQQREVPSPEAIIEGQPRAGAPTRAQLNPPDGLPCTYESGGAQMGGRTPKFTCRQPNGRPIRVKYFSGDPDHGNREVFSEVVTTRLFWALGLKRKILAARCPCQAGYQDDP